MGKKVLVTGGAGFIGSHTVDALIERGDVVRVFDNLNPQVHGPAAEKPLYLHEGVEFIQGDVRDRDSQVTFISHPISVEVYLWGYAIALPLSLMLTLILVKAIREENWLTRLLNKLPISNVKQVSPFGGVPVILSFFAVLWFSYLGGWVHQENLRLFQVITLGVGLMTILGIYDDIYNCPPKTKLFFQVAIAMILYFAGFQIERVGDMIELGPFSILLTVLWIVGITNSLNLIDGIDGLASGFVLLSCMTLSFVYLDREIGEASFLTVTLAGSVLGFFIFNFPPAKIILGDTGSLPLGLIISLITLLPLNQKFTDEIYYLIPIITLLLPILDTTFAFFRRFLKGVSPFSRDTKHFHHRLASLGVSPVKSISILFIICLYFDLTALVPTHNINLIPKFIPFYFIFVVVNITLLLALLRHLENKKSRT